MVESPILHTFGFSVANATSQRSDEGFLLGYSTTSKAYGVWNLASGTLEEVHGAKFDETNGSQEEDENLDDVRGTQLVSQNRPNYKSSSVETIDLAIKFLDLSPYNPSSQLKS